MANGTSLQAVMRQCLDPYSASHRLSPHQWQVCRHVLDCRTPALGGLRLQCDQCHATQPHYHACRDRHCPRCQRRASQDWCARQRAAVLPVTYHHLVFTLPHALNPWVEVHDRQLYAVLFETVWATLRAFGADPKRLGGQMGMTAVLHTWGQSLGRHVHLHCLVPGGAYAAPGHWHPAKSTYLFPVRALSRRLRGGFVSRLRQALDSGQFERLTDTVHIETMLDTLMATDWVVYAKPCVTSTETVVDYLGRYSHRIALSDARLLGHDAEQVALRYQDYRDGGKHKVMQLSGEELIRRYLLHVLPKGFMRIRHFGFLANRCRAKRLAQIRTAIAQQHTQVIANPPAEPNATPPFDGFPCTRCRPGWMQVVARLAPQRDTGG
jgi:hypothetical protein